MKTRSAHLEWIAKVTENQRKRRLKHQRRITPKVDPAATLEPVGAEYRLLHLLWRHNNVYPYWKTVNELAVLAGTQVTIRRPEARFQVALITRLVREGKVARSTRTLCPISKFIGKMLKEQGKHYRARRSNELRLTAPGEQRLRELFGSRPETVPAPAYKRNEKLIGVLA